MYQVFSCNRCHRNGVSLGFSLTRATCGARVARRVRACARRAASAFCSLRLVPSAMIPRRTKEGWEDWGNLILLILVTLDSFFTSPPLSFVRSFLSYLFIFLPIFFLFFPLFLSLYAASFFFVWRTVLIKKTLPESWLRKFSFHLFHLDSRVWIVKRVFYIYYICVYYLY